MKRVRAYVSDTYAELMTKVSWPTWKELQGSAVIVMVSTLITALLIFAIDWLFSEGMKAIYKFIG